ncbi:receptor-like cytosolic serine/threonine-protein kinase RBK1 isoform X2 [Amborella trichopoda]|uniref:receptor-like cytosolic serine/threonine-protein kinase RBK1 isoform X2 n=1 Tax=Amborella trichopoda TaxID=13333 RepID=UPI0009C15289|nr:receptor-like cytosolic serine/threonine-protein kinase RBK1 isoform X2 [Amborella trichopoda]|eukprot:XP_020530925.1 receptor-like cytosolic serine/threonine-protein kinase RBK1 isoform X2 [Amborella trichopoda]
MVSQPMESDENKNFAHSIQFLIRYNLMKGWKKMENREKDREKTEDSSHKTETISEKESYEKDQEKTENSSHKTKTNSEMENHAKDQEETQDSSPKTYKNTDQSSPRGVLEIPVLGLDSDSNSSSSSNRDTETSIAIKTPTSEHHGLQWRSLVNALKHKSMRKFSTFPPFGGKRNWVRIRDTEEKEELPVLRPQASWRCFDHEELMSATNNFSSENLIGKGGHAEVYKGILVDGQLVAVKRLIKREREDERIGDFLSELGIIAHINHPNAAHLIGFGVEGGLHLVLQFSPHGSLSSVLHEENIKISGTNQELEWGIRYKIALGIAEGLMYLHEGCHRRIIHRDIKASNILLAQDFQPQISDFGLAKWLPDQWTHHVVSPIEGTFGYLAPEYFMHGIVDEKTDVFAFGVLLLELITGRRAVDSCLQSLVMWAKPLLDAKKMKELADPRLGDTYNTRQMGYIMFTASLCVHHLAISRPRMNQVVRLLKGKDLMAETFVQQPKTLVGSQLFLDGDDYTSSRYLSDLNRYKQLALET